MNCTFPCARKADTETEPSALADCQRPRLSIIGAVPGAFHIWRMKRAKFAAPLFAYKCAQFTPIDRPISSSTFGDRVVEIERAQNFGRACCNGLQNSIASVQVTLSGLPFGDSAVEIGGQAPLNDLAASNGSDPTIGAKADQPEHGSECRNHQSHGDRHRIAAGEKGEGYRQGGGNRESDQRRQKGRIARDGAGHHAADNKGYKCVIRRIRRNQDARCGQSPKATRRGRAGGIAPTPARGQFRLRRRCADSACDRETAPEQRCRTARSTRRTFGPAKDRAARKR